VAPILAQRGQLSEALRLCQIAIDNGSPVEGGTAAVAAVAPQGPEAVALVKEAGTILDKALKQKPDHFGLLFARASLKRRMSRYDEAAQMYRDMSARSPDNPALLNNWAWTLSEDLNQPAEGLEKINAAIKLVGPNPSFLDTRGVILTRLDKLNEAIEDMEAAAKTGPSAALYYHLARTYKKAGRTAEFQKYRDLAKQAGLTAGQLEPNERPEMQQLMK
jgi:Tfp pilus assembly protein PilF